MIPHNNSHCVFIVGSARSGTTLMNSILMAAEDFAIYEAETLLLDVCGPKYGPLKHSKNFQNFTHDWLRSKQFQRSGLARNEFMTLAQQHRASYLDLLGAMMDAIAAKQGVMRWADSTPSNIFHLKAIAEHFPNAKILHMTRDGRDVCSSLRRLGWSGTNSNEPIHQLLSAGIKWEINVKTARCGHTSLGNRFMEIKYEDLVIDTDEMLKKISAFLATNIDKNTIQKSPHGSLKKSNSAFNNFSNGISADAVDQWKSRLSENEIIRLEAYIGPTLSLLGYKTSSKKLPSFKALLSKLLGTIIMRLRAAIKRSTVIGRFSANGLEFIDE